MDESHFGRFSNLPYAWQPIGKYLPLEVFHEKRFTITGILNENYFHYWLTENTNKQEIFIQYIEEFISKINKKTVLILDNASIHKGKLVQNFLKKWEESGLFLFFLPPYSPHLNKIEILWRSVKRLISIDFRKSYTDFKNRVCSLLNNYIGSNYEISLSR